MQPPPFTQSSALVLLNTSPPLPTPHYPPRLCRLSPPPSPVCQVTIYDPLTLQATRTLSRFKDVALSVSFRPDGRLLSSSSHDGVIQTFDTSSRMILRTYTGHVGPVWSVCHSKSFSSLLSAGDDLTVRLWDVSSQAEVASYTGHKDYVRAVREEADGHNLLISASYDGTVRGWDRRLPPDTACTWMLQHGAPVNAFALIPSSAASASLSLISAGDVSLKAWDLRYVSSSTPALAPVRELSSHQKAITALCLDPSHSRLLSASLDGFVKVTHLPDLQPLSSLKVGSPILACGLSPDATVLAVGTVDGTLTLKQRPAPPPAPAPRPLPRMGSHAWFNRGAHSSPSPLTPQDSSAHAPRRPVLQAYDVYLKRFQYHAALDAALRTNRAVVIGAMLEELIDRGGLQVAVGGRDEEGMKALLGWLLMYVSHPGYMGVALDVMGVVLKVYGAVVGESRVMDEWVRRVEEKVKDEVAVMEHMMRMRGAMELLWRGTERLAPAAQVASAQAAQDEEEGVGADDDLQPRRRRREEVSIEEAKEEEEEERVEGRPAVVLTAAAQRLGHSRRKGDEEEEERKEGEAAEMETDADTAHNEAEQDQPVQVTKQKAKKKKRMSQGSEEEVKAAEPAVVDVKRKSKAKRTRHSIA